MEIPKSGSMMTLMCWRSCEHLNRGDVYICKRCTEFHNFVFSLENPTDKHGSHREHAFAQSLVYSITNTSVFSQYTYNQNISIHIPTEVCIISRSEHSIHTHINTVLSYLQNGSAYNGDLQYVLCILTYLTCCIISFLQK